MTQDYKPGDNVIWINPASGTEITATIVKEVPPQSPIGQGSPNNPGPQSFPAIAQLERCFEIKVKETGKTMTVPTSQLSRAK